MLDLNVMSNLPMKIDISEPNILLTMYELSVQTEKPSKRAAIIASTKRMIKSCIDMQNALAKSLQSKTDGLKGWIGKRRLVKELKQRLAHATSRLQTWVSATLAGAIKKTHHPHPGKQNSSALIDSQKPGIVFSASC